MDDKKILELEKLLKYYKKIALIDEKTGIYNYRYFLDMLHKEYQRSIRYGLTFSVLMLDVDDFKKYNDTKGHIAGDKLLKQIATILKCSIRAFNHIARFGGDEFVVILAQTNLKEALIIAERIRKKIKKETKVTISIGVNEYKKIFNSFKIVEEADKKLYIAKKEGKDKVRG